MRTHSLIVTWLCIAGMAVSSSAPGRLQRLKTKNGTTYEDVRFKKLLNDDVLIYHAKGAARIPLCQLSDDDRTRLGIPTAAQLAERRRGLVEYKGHWMKPAKKAELEYQDKQAEARKKATAIVLSKSKKSVLFKLIQILADGALCVSQRFDPRWGWTYDGEFFFLYLTDTKMVADDEVYREDIYWCGTYSYTTVRGVRKTVNSYSAAKSRAIAIVEKKFGLGPKESRGSHEASRPPRKGSGGASELSQYRGFGSGFFVTKQGVVLTNYHVVAGSKGVWVRTQGSLLSAKVLGTDKDNDLALLQVQVPANMSLTAAVLSGQRSAKLGETVFTVGFPLPTLQGFSPKVTKGVVSGLKGVGDDPKLYQIDASVQPGNSGGPLADSSGQLIGVVVARLSDAAVMRTQGVVPQNINYAVKLSYVRAFIDSFPDVAKAAEVAEGPEGMKFEEAVDRVRRASVMVLVR